jgi:hypothetical protein
MYAHDYEFHLTQMKLVEGEQTSDLVRHADTISPLMRLSL